MASGSIDPPSGDNKRPSKDDPEFLEDQMAIMGLYGDDDSG